jgi:hypothetical protein
MYNKGEKADKKTEKADKKTEKAKKRRLRRQTRRRRRPKGEKEEKKKRKDSRDVAVKSGEKPNSKPLKKAKKKDMVLSIEMDLAKKGVSIQRS